MFRRVVIRLALLEALWLMIREAWSEVNRSGTRQSPAA